MGKDILKHAVLIESTEKRGLFKITQDGRMLEESKPQEVDSKHLRKYSKFIEYMERSIKKKLLDDLVIEDNKIIHNIKPTRTSLEELYIAIKDSLRNELLEKLKQVDVYKFENIVVDLIIRMRYEALKLKQRKVLQKRR